jgi:hypothetical protein
VQVQQSVLQDFEVVQEVWDYLQVRPHVLQEWHLIVQAEGEHTLIIWAMVAKHILLLAAAVGGKGMLVQAALQN